jgi:hypothetical protein
VGDFCAVGPRRGIIYNSPMNFGQLKAHVLGWAKASQGMDLEF